MFTVFQEGSRGDKCSGSKELYRGLKEATKQAIVDKHNEYRRRVAKGEEPGQPVAKNMRKLVWPILTI